MLAIYQAHFYWASVLLKNLHKGRSRVNKIKLIIASVSAAIFSLAGVFFYGLSKGKREKEYEILKKNAEDALETNKREEARRNDSIDDVVKRMRDYTDK